MTGVKIKTSATRTRPGRGRGVVTGLVLKWLSSGMGRGKFRHGRIGSGMFDPLHIRFWATLTYMTCSAHFCFSKLFFNFLFIFTRLIFRVALLRMALNLRSLRILPRVWPHMRHALLIIETTMKLNKVLFLN